MFIVQGSILVMRLWKNYPCTEEEQIYWYKDQGLSKTFYIYEGIPSIEFRTNKYIQPHYIWGRIITPTKYM